MYGDILGSIISFLGGGVVGYLGYLISKKALISKSALFSYVSIIRTVLQVGYLVAVYLIAPLTPCKLIYLLIGAALGLTVSMFIFTYRLVKISDARAKAARDAEKKPEIGAGNADDKESK